MKKNIVHGTWEDRNRYIRCKICNFIVDRTKYINTGYSGVYVIIGVPIYNLSGELKYLPVTNDTIKVYDGNNTLFNVPVPVLGINYRYQDYDVSTGCPFCGGTYE